MLEIPLIPLIYVGGAVVTTLFLLIVFLVIWYNNDHVKPKWTDVPLSILCVVGWPVFWILWIASRIFK